MPNGNQGKPEDQIAARLDAMARLAREMAAIYDDPMMNEAQPPDMQRVIPMSLDEWAALLPHVANEWRQIGFEREQMRHLASSEDGRVVVRSALKD